MVGIVVEVVYIPHNLGKRWYGTGIEIDGRSARVNAHGFAGIDSIQALLGLQKGTLLNQSLTDGHPLVGGACMRSLRTPCDIHLTLINVSSFGIRTDLEWLLFLAKGGRDSDLRYNQQRKYRRAHIESLFTEK